jgi:antitoxin VapB
MVVRMAMNIKNERAESLARAVAERTGESLTTAIAVALEERLARIKHDESSAATYERLSALVADVQSLMGGDSFDDPNDFLYDDDGIPK